MFQPFEIPPLYQHVGSEDILTRCALFSLAMDMTST